MQRKRSRDSTTLLPKSLLEKVSSSGASSSSYASKKTPSRKELRRRRKRDDKKRRLMTAERQQRKKHLQEKKRQEEQQQVREQQVEEADQESDEEGSANDSELNEAMDEQEDEQQQQQSEQSDEEQEDEDQEDEQDDNVDDNDGNDAAAFSASSASAPPPPPSSSSSGSRYVPPHLRGHSTPEGNVERSVRRLLNKVAESNLRSLADDISKLVDSGVARSTVGSAVTRCMIADVENAVVSGAKLVAIYGALAGVLLHEMGFGIGFASELAEAAVAKFEEAHAAGNVKACLLLVQLFCYLYHFDVVSHVPVAQLCKRLTAAFTEMDAEILLKVLQLSGMKLRADVPGELAELVVALNEAVARRGDAAKDERAKFIVETLASIKNNRYFRNDEELAKLKKALKTVGGHAQQKMPRFSWDDLVQARKTNERWWLRAGALEQEAAMAQAKAAKAKEDALPTELAFLAKKLRFNTDFRRRVFGVLMTAEGAADAFGKLMRLQLKGKADRDVVFVLCESCCHERKYNHYYALVAVKLCQNDPKMFPVTLQYYLWDQIRLLHERPATERSNLALFVKELLANDCLTLRVFQPVDFLTEMGVEAREFCNVVLSRLIVECPPCVVLFQKLASKQSDEVKLLRDGLEIFLRYSLTFKADLVHDGNKRDVKARLKEVKKALRNE